MDGPTPDEEPAPSHGVAIAALALTLAFVVLAAQNSTSVDVHLLLWHVHAPLYGLAVASALLGAIVIEATGGLWRRRRQVRDREHRELLRLRGSRRPRSGDSPAQSR